VSLMRYELGFYISEDDILHSHRRKNLKSCYGIALQIAVATRSTKTNCVPPLNQRGRGFESDPRHEYLCPRIMCLCRLVFR
jgi:hypothetical protein